MVESNRRSRDLTEASKNNFAKEKFFVSAEDQIQITDLQSQRKWSVNIHNCVPFVVAVNELVDDKLKTIGRHKSLVPNKLYQVGGQSIYIMTTLRMGDGVRLLKMIGPEGTKFEKMGPREEVS